VKVVGAVATHCSLALTVTVVGEKVAGVL